MSLRKLTLTVLASICISLTFASYLSFVRSEETKSALLLAQRSINSSVVETAKSLEPNQTLLVWIVNPDRVIDILDLVQTSLHFGASGTYSSDLSGVTANYTTTTGSGIVIPDQKGFVLIPSNTLCITINRNGVSIGAMIIFYRN